MTKRTWHRKEEWKTTDHQTYTVVVSRHEGSPLDSSEGPHRWCVYAYIYPEHPHFKNFNGEGLAQDAAADLPLHCGATYCVAHRGANCEITSYQVGSDYHHLYDARYTHMATPEDAYSVFADAERLVEWLESHREAA